MTPIPSSSGEKAVYRLERDGTNYYGRIVGPNLPTKFSLYDWPSDQGWLVLQAINSAFHAGELARRNEIIGIVKAVHESVSENWGSPVVTGMKKATDEILRAISTDGEEKENR